MTKWIALAASALTLAACQQQADTANNSAAIAPADNVAAKVAAMSETERNVVLIRAIRDAGLQCQHVTGSERMENPETQTWRAQCENGIAHIVQITPDGTAKIISRRS